MAGFVTFMLSAPGRALRVVAGLILLSVGWLIVGGAWGVVIAIVGLVPVFAGAAGVCLLAPLFGYTFEGAPRRGHAR